MTLLHTGKCTILQTECRLESLIFFSFKNEHILFYNKGSYKYVLSLQNETPGANHYTKKNMGTGDYNLY